MKLAAEAVAAEKNEVLPLATQVRILHANGELEKSKEAFTKLRTVAATADRELPIFAPLGSIAAEFGFPKEWQMPLVAAKDLGPRPNLDELGPFRWSPPTAPDFSLQDTKGTTVTLSSRKERPILVIFYLGHGCSHCMEQLNAFAPLYKRFAAAGIDVVAISTDSVSGLNETFAGEGKENFPFPLLSDESLTAFKAFRAYDDFESLPLHGTFLIDRSQRIRWQEISFDPMMQPEWLLEESIRLLSLPEES